MKRLHIKPEETVFIGNDINDIDCLNYVGHPFVVADSCQSFKEDMIIKSNVNITTEKGGNGAVREVCEWILKQK